MRPVRFGVAVVNWNGRDDTLACLQSMLAAEPRPARVVVVDNASTDDSVPSVSAWIAREAGSGFELLVSDTNRGFAGASNLALERLTSDPTLTHFLLLNNDATVDRRCFADIDRALSEAPTAGILGVTIYEIGAARRPWYAGGSVDALRGLGRHHHMVPEADSRVIPTEFVTGCAMVISRRTWDELGRLPECYFMYCEDTEYCVRARAAGIAVVYAPRPVVYHRVASVARRGVVAAPLAEYRFERSRALFVRRNLRGATRWGASAYLVVAGFVRAVLRTVRGRPIRAWTAFRGTLAGLLAIEGKDEAGQPAAAQRARERVAADQ